MFNGVRGKYMHNEWTEKVENIIREIAILKIKMKFPEMETYKI